MPSCQALPYDCAPPDPDNQSDDEAQNEQLVRDFIDATWNTQTLRADMAASLDRFFDGGYQRHRRNEDGDTKKGGDQAGLYDCIEKVRNALQDVHVTVLDVAVCGDCVTALILIEAVDQRPDQQLVHTDVQRAFGLGRTTGRRIRVTTAVLFCLSNGK